MQVKFSKLIKFMNEIKTVKFTLKVVLTSEKLEILKLETERHVVLFLSNLLNKLTSIIESSTTQ